MVDNVKKLVKPGFKFYHDGEAWKIISTAGGTIFAQRIWGIAKPEIFKIKDGEIVKAT